MSKLIIASVAAIALFATNANADCICQCVDGQMQSVCESSIDIPRACMGICSQGYPDPGIGYGAHSRMGTDSCEPHTVQDSDGNYRTEELCQ